MIQEAVLKLLERLPACEAELSDPALLTDQKRYRTIAAEHARLLDIRNHWQSLQKAEKELADLKALAGDPEMMDLLQGEEEALIARQAAEQNALEHLLIPPDPRDDLPIIVEVRAGTGGEEAALFVADMVRMYQYYANAKGWKIETLSSSPSDMGGFKEYVMTMTGPQVFRCMQYEGGTHRVQRVPATEAQGRIHTSAVTVAILPEPQEDEEVVIDEKDLRVDTYRSSGAGGQHVNTTDSAVRLTHMPTGVVVYCQEERSQHKNKEKAMRLLKARIADDLRQKKHAAIASTRALQVGSGDRSERIRTYNFPQNRITDHRVGITLYNLDRAMEGDIDGLSQALVAHFRQRQLEG